MKSSRGCQWLVALAAAVCALVLSACPERAGESRRARPEPRDRITAERFDEPDVAALFEYRRRAPAISGLDTVALYAAAEARLARMPRFSSRIGRILPNAQPAARVWFSGNRVTSLSANESLGILDAWQPLGPGNVGGRTRVVRFHPTRPNTIFAAGVSGGIWRLDDIGGSWRPIAESLINIAVNALVIDPREPDVMYAGTGEGFIREEIRGTGLPLRGAGIFATRDGGRSWQRLPGTGTSDFHWVNDLELGIGDTRRVYAATRTGVWRSLDAGETWTRLLATTVRAGCLELAMRPDRQDDVLLASCGSYEQATVYRFNRASVSADAEVVLREPGMGRTSLAISPSHPDVMYAMAASNDPGPGDNYRQALLAVFRSDRAGDPGSWEPRVTNGDPTRLGTLLLTNIYGATAQECSTNPDARNSYTNMGWYVNVLAVDPRDPNRVWAGGVDWFRSDDGGRSWGLATISAPGPSFAHVDQHGIAFHPGYDGDQNQVALIGNDGGVYRTTTARAPVATGPRAACTPGSVGVNWQDLNRGYGVTQFYHGLPYANGTRYLAGAQDNGTVAGFDETGPEAWRMLFGGDGSYVAVPNSGSPMFVQSQWSNIAKSTNGGGNFTGARRGLDGARADALGPDANFLFVTPLLMDPSTSQRLWTGGDFLYRTGNAAELWMKASTQMPDGGLVSAIAIAPVDSNRVIAGTHRGHVVSSTEALQATVSTEWRAARPREGWVTAVAFDPQTPDIVYATYGNFGDSHVFRSTDAGATWAALDGSGDAALPDIPVHSIVVDPDDPSRLYLGTDVGVFVSVEGGRRWMVEETGFGAAVTEWLALTRDANGRKLLFAFTHGRSAWRVSLP